MEKPIQDIALEILNKLSPGDCLECEWQSGHTVFKFGVKKDYKPKEDSSNAKTV